MSRHRNLRKVSTDVDYDDDDEYYDEDDPTDSYSRQYIKGANDDEEEDYSSYGAPSHNPPPKVAPPATGGYTPQVKAKGGKKKGGSGGTPAKPASPAPVIPKATPDKLPVASAITPSKPVSLSFHSNPSTATLSSHASAGVPSASGPAANKAGPMTLDLSSKSKLNSGDAARPSVASHIAAGLVQNAHGSPRTDSPTVGSSTPATGSPSVDKPSIRRSTSMDIAAANRRDKERRQVLEEETKAASGKEQLNLVFVGHVDAGKSTLMGHLLYQVGRVDQRTIHKYEKESKNIGKASFHFAWVLDSSAEERARGITQDVGVNHFETASKTITLLDAPGHRDFIPNMISGAAQADAAVLVVPATKGEFEAGFADNGQTKEHALLCRSSGVGQVIIAVNKLDTCDWSESRYNDIVEQVTLFLRQAGYKPNTIWSVPVSGLSGENLLKATDATLLKWYKGPSLVEAIDKYFTPPERQLEKPFRLCVTDTFKSMNLGVTVAGKVEAGTVMPKDKVLLMPGGEAVTVKAVENQGTPLRIAKAGDNVEIGLKDLNEASNVVAGMYLCAVDYPIPLVTRFRAQVLVLGIKIPLMKGTEVELFTQSVHVPATISKLVHSLNKATGEIIKERPRHLTRNTSAAIEVTTETPICLELYSQFRQLGRFSLRRESETVAVGIVSEILQAST